MTRCPQREPPAAGGYLAALWFQAGTFAFKEKGRKIAALRGAEVFALGARGRCSAILSRCRVLQLFFL